MFVRNTTSSYQCFRAGDESYKIDPEATAEIDDSHMASKAVKTLLSRGVLVKAVGDVVDVPKIEVPQPPAVVEMPKVVNTSQDNVNESIVVKCAAHYANGKPCTSNVNVPFEDYSEDRPFFCGRHLSEDPESYTKVDGEWVKSAAPAGVAATAPVETPDADNGDGDNAAQNPNDAADNADGDNGEKAE